MSHCDTCNIWRSLSIAPYNSNKDLNRQDWVSLEKGRLIFFLWSSNLVMSKIFVQKGASWHLLKSQNYFQKTSCKWSNINNWYKQSISDLAILHFRWVYWVWSRSNCTGNTLSWSIMRHWLASSWNVNFQWSVVELHFLRNKLISSQFPIDLCFHL